MMRPTVSLPLTRDQLLVLILNEIELAGTRCRNASISKERAIQLQDSAKTISDLAQELYALVVREEEGR